MNRKKNTQTWIYDMYIKVHTCGKDHTRIWIGVCFVLFALFLWKPIQDLGRIGNILAQHHAFSHLTPSRPLTAAIGVVSCLPKKPEKWKRFQRRMNDFYAKEFLWVVTGVCTPTCISNLNIYNVMGKYTLKLYSHLCSSNSSHSLVYLQFYLG